MKKSLLIATGLVLLSTSAYATKSRLTALGQGDGGSHYIDDSRNVFLNPAHAGTMTNYIVTEWDGATDNGEGEGGFFKEAGSFNYGVYMNANNYDQDATAQGGTGYAGTGAFGATGFANRSDDLDLFFAGDMGFQWGARIGYTKSNAKTSTEPEQTHKGMSLGAGVVFGDLEGSIDFVLSDDYENDGTATAGAKGEGSSMKVDVAYNWGSWTFFAGYDKKGFDFTSATGAQKAETEQTTMLVGAGHTHEVSSTARVYSDVTYQSTKGTDKLAGATQEAEDKTARIRANIGFEADANSWLTWRGSISQNVLIDSDEFKAAGGTTSTESDNTSTAVNAGMTLNFGKLKVDGTIGTGTGTFNTDTLLSEVGVHYWF